MSKDEYTKTHLITYIGNKRKLLDLIEEQLIIIKKKLGKDLLISLDAFSGSGCVSRLLKYHSSDLIVNDLEEYSYIINKCYLSNPSKEERVNINRMIHELNNLNYDNEGVICNHYAPKETYNIQPGERAFYTRENALIIDTIRNKINNYDNKYSHYLLAPLLIKASINTNTSGVFKGFHKKHGIGHFGGKDEVNTTSRITKQIVLEKPIFSEHKHNCDIFIYKEDINKLISELPIVDVAYLDPPYNQHPYGSNYFMLNTIIQNKVGNNISYISGIPSDWNRSNYNYANTCIDSMKYLLSNIKCKYIIMSYNNEGIISEEDMIQIIQGLDYNYTLKKMDYNTYRGSRNLRDRDKKVIEYLWIINKFE